MSSPSTREKDVRVSVENVGGIDETEVGLERGVNVLTGRNATNRTSFLQSIMAAMGSSNVSLKGDAEEGHVELRVDGETATRTLQRTENGVRTGGDPYLDDPEIADLFAFLLESNEVRRAIVTGADLRDVIVRPIDTEEIRAEIEYLESEKRAVDAKLEELDGLESERSRLERRETELDDEIAKKRAELAETEERIDDAEGDVERQRDRKAELEEKLSELQRIRSEFEDVRFRIETERESLASLREERAEIEDRLAELPDGTAEEDEEIGDEIERLRGRKQSLESLIGRLQTVVQFNQEVLDGDDQLLAMLGATETDESVTDRLLADSETISCWACGEQVERDALEENVDQLRELLERRVAERERVDSELGELKDRRQRLEQRRRERERIETRLDRIDDEVDEREAAVEGLKAEQEQKRDEVTNLEDEIDDLEDEDYQPVLALHREANELELELERLSDERDEVTDEIATVERRLDERESLRERREALTDELAEQRTRIEEVERTAVGQFNEHIAELLDHLEYDNLDRIWIERTTREERQGRRTVERSSFDLHVVRTTEDGTAYEDTVDHLSESEREVTGLVFALAGYIVHDVHDTVPFMLLDSLEAVDSDRIARLIDYFEEYSEHVVVALLPEDAAAVDEKHHRVDSI